jgi:aspartyl protease family protein
MNLAQHESLDRLWGALLDMFYRVAELLHGAPMLRWGLLSVAALMLGQAVRYSLPSLGGLMRFVGHLGLIVVMGWAVLTYVGVDALGLRGVLPAAASRFLPGEGEQEQVVEGNTTRITLARDGHCWIRAKINGVPHRLLIDTGATLTTLTPETAQDAGVEIDAGGRSIGLRTANGMAKGQLARIDELRMGTIVARNLEAVVAPGLGETNVLGMNFLTRLASWRVEGKVMVLEPHHPNVQEE